MSDSSKNSERMRKRLFNELVENVPAVFYDVPLMTKSARGYVSPQCQKILGFTPTKPYNFLDNLLALIPTKQQEEFRVISAKAQKRCDSFTFEAPIVSDQEHEKYILIKGSFVRFSDPQNLRLIGIIIDISSRKKIENSLRAREERYRKITERISDYVFTIVVNDGEIVETIHGGACQPITGYSPEEFADNPDLWLEMVHPSDKKLVKQRADRMIKNEDVEQLAHRIIHKTGNVRWINSTIVTHRDKEGNILFFDGVIRDITSAKRAEELNKQKMYMNELITEALPFAAVLLTEDGEVVALNDAGSKMGFKQSESWNIAWSEINSAYECTQLLNNAMTSSERHCTEITHNGQVFEVTLTPREPDLCLVTFYNISARKQADENLQADKLLIKSLLNNPLIAIAVVNPQGKFELINNSAATILGVSPAEACGLSLHEVFPLAEANLKREIIKKTYNSLKPIRITENVNGKQLDTMIIPILDEHKQPLKIAIFSRDISDENRSSEQLVETYQTLVNIVEHSPVAIITTDMTGKVQLWNPAAEIIFGWKSSEIYGKNIPIFGSEIKALLNAVKKEIQQNKAFKRENLNGQTKSQSSSRINLNAAPLQDAQGRANGIIFIIEKQQ